MDSKIAALVDKKKNQYSKFVDPTGVRTSSWET